MVRARLLLVALLLIGTAAAAPSRAPAAEWPAERQYLLAEPPTPLHLFPPASAVAEDTDGSLLLLLYWPVIRAYGDGSVSESPRTRLVRVAPDGSRAFVPLGPGSGGDEVLPLPDGSILFTRDDAIDRRRPDGSIVRVAGTGRPGAGASGDGGPATAADIGLVHGLTRFPDGSIVFGTDQHRVRRVAPDGTITTVAGTGEFGFGGDGGPATAAQLRFPSDTLPMPDGGFLIADTYNGRVRRVGADGIITTVAGVDKPEISDSFGDGGPASAAWRPTARSARSSGCRMCTAPAWVTSPGASPRRSRPWTRPARAASSSSSPASTCAPSTSPRATRGAR